MKRILVCGCSIILGALFVSEIVYAKEYMYVGAMRSNEIVKFDTETGQIVNTVKLKGLNHVQEGESSIVLANNKAFIVDGKYDIGVKVYNLNTSRFISELDIQTKEPSIRMFATPDEKRMFIVWWNKDLAGGAMQFDVYDTDTLERIKTLDYYFWTGDISYSPDEKILYSINYGGRAIVIEVELTNYTKTRTIDLNDIWDDGYFTHSIPNYKSNVILVSQSNKVPDKYKQYSDTLFTYNMIANTSSVRINTGMDGDYALSESGDKILQNERVIVWNNKGRLSYTSSLGRIHVYDVASGNKVGVIEYSGGKNYEFLRTHPIKPHAYLVGWRDDNKYLTIVNFETFEVVRDIKFDLFSTYYYFHEEPDEAPAQ